MAPRPRPRPHCLRFVSSNLGPLVYLRFSIPAPLRTSPLENAQNILIKYCSSSLLYLSFSQA